MGESKIEVLLDWRVLAITAAFIIILILAIRNLENIVLDFAKVLSVVVATIEPDQDVHEINETVSLKVCVSDWLKFDKVDLEIAAPDGRIIYLSSIPVDKGCSSVVLQLATKEQGVYLVIVKRKEKVLATSTFRISD